MRISIVGTGYVGLTTGIVLAYLGNQVICIDVNENKINDLSHNILPFYEPGLDELFKLSKSNISFTTDFEWAIPRSEVIFITVGTPPLPNGSPNTKYLEDCSNEIGKYLNDHFTVIINKSTVPIGSGNWVENMIFDAFAEKNGYGPKNLFAVVSNPEFLREGSAIADTFYPERIILGTDNQRAIDILQELYAPIIQQSFNPPEFLAKPEGIHSVPFVTTSLISAEMIKYSANTFLALKISFINEIAALTEKVGGDITQIAKGIGLDRRIGPSFLNAGIGWGGSCFGKDICALQSTAKEYGLHMPIVEGAGTVNYQLRNRVVEKIAEDIKIFKGKTIGILGLAFKPDTDDIRDAPSIDIARLFLERGSKIIAHDPIAIENAKRVFPPDTVKFEVYAENVFNNADAVILATEWPQYKELNWVELKDRMKNPLVFDGRNFMDKNMMMTIGYKYMGVGR